MKSPQQAIGEVVFAVIVLVIALAGLYLFGAKVVDLLQSPAREESLRGNNAALAAGATKANAATKARGAETVRRKAESKKAVEAAGTKEAARAEAILKAAPEGDTDYERMVRRIDRELGLK